ncbi:3'-5' exonuclease [Nitriliruptor alkaliphilus]|uniref:3'-5' exonuclease n=1 Tax=Nitriliruptor alkaliphilus TaxID=427918 RepID=UPI000697E902|nr:3'-5' exonuclease [Nitriliruptor alkaliphilus]
MSTEPSATPPVTDATTPAFDTSSEAADASERRGTRFVFVDTEATGLDHRRHELTEVAWIVRFEDGREEERRYFPTHTTDGADDDALELTHYDERIAPQDKTPSKVWLTEFLEHADGAVLVGAVPDFDARHLDLACHKLGVEPTWDHHLLDVETLALPFIAEGPEMPRSLAKTCAALDIPHDRDQAHGALYDAQQARAVFDRVWQLVADLRASGGPLPPPVPRDNGRREQEPVPGVSTEDATAQAVETAGATDTGQPDHAAG